MRWACLLASLFLAAPAATAGAGSVRSFCAAGGACWAVGDGGLILRSDDAGVTWRRQRPAGVAAEAGRADFSGVHFRDSQIGTIFGGRFIPGHPRGASVGLILQTGDGGRSWRLIAPAGVARLHGGHVEGARGLAFGMPTPACPWGLWATETGGQSWQPLPAPSRGALLAGDFGAGQTRDSALGASAGLGQACLVGPRSRIVLVESSPARAGSAPAVRSDSALAAARWVADDACWVAGENGTTYVVTPSGQLRRPKAPPLAGPARRLADFEALASDANRGVYLAGGLVGRIFCTRDGGASFRALPAPGPGPIHALGCTPEGALLAGGDAGRIWRSGDAGTTWRLVHGPDTTDVLFLAGPGDVSILPAVAAHAAAGAEVAVVFAAVPAIAGPLRGDGFLRAAGTAAGAGGVLVLTDFDSVAGDAEAAQLLAGDVLRRWSGRLDLPAREEALRQMAAAIRLYRPRVVACGPDGHEATGTAAENHLVSRLAAEAVKLAADPAALPELAQVGLAPWRPERFYTGLDGNDEYAPPWSERPAGADPNLAVRFTGWQYPADRGTSLSMLAMGAAWLLPWVGGMDRPAAVTDYRCRELTGRRALFTAGLTPARLRLRRPAPIGDGLASGAVLRAGMLTRQNVLAGAGPLLKAARQHPQDPLPADMLHLLLARLLGKGRLAEAAEIRRALLNGGGAHPLFQRQNVSAVAMSISAEWLPHAGPAHLPGQAELTSMLARLGRWPWQAWVDDEPGLALLGRAYGLAGDPKSAALVYERLAGTTSARLQIAARRDLETSDRAWQEFVQVERLGQSNPAAALAAAKGFVLPVAAESVLVDGKLEEDLWQRAKSIVLAPASGPLRGQVPVAVRMAATPSELALAVRIGQAEPTATRPAGSPTQPAGLFDESDSAVSVAPAWRLTLAVDSDRDAWTQLVLRCDSTAGRSLALLTRLAPEAALPVSLLPVQARQAAGAWTIELALPRQLIGISAQAGGFVRMQLAVDARSGKTGEATFYLARQPDPRLLPHRYALVAVPAAAVSGP